MVLMELAEPLLVEPVPYVDVAVRAASREGVVRWMKATQKNVEKRCENNEAFT